MTPSAGLTARGTGVLATGAAVAVGGALIGSLWLVAAGVFLLALVAVAVAAALLRAARAGLVLRIEPRLLRVGQRFHVSASIAVPVAGRLQVDGLLPEWADRTAAAAQPTARGTRRGTLVEARGTAAVRGIFQGHRVRVRLADPFDIAAAVLDAAADGPVVVGPRIEPLRVMPGRAGGSGAPSRQSGRRGAGRDVGPLPRPFEPGDELRHMHWPATARTGEPMVRSRAGGGHRLAEVLLDRRRDAYSSGESFELAVSAAGSLAVALLRAGWAVRLAVGPRHDPAGRAPLTGAAGEAELLRRLAEVRPDAAEGPAAADRTGAVYAVWGRLPPSWTDGAVAELSTEPGSDAVLRWDGSVPLSTVLAHVGVGR